MSSTDWEMWKTVDALCKGCSWRGKLVDGVCVAGETVKCPGCGRELFVRIVAGDDVRPDATVTIDKGAAP